jgi:hypothetical protein
MLTKSATWCLILDMESKNFTQLDDDKALIESYGGSARLARILGLTGVGAVQRVNNWKTRGIPPAVKLGYPHIFLPHLKTKSRNGAR